MKKSGFALLLVIAALQASAQKSFYSGALVFSFNYGVDGNTANQHYITPGENSAQTFNGTASASNYNIAAELGLTGWLGVGLIGRIDNFSMQNNQYAESSPTAGAVDLGGTVNLHVLRFSHLDLLAGVDWGVSQFNYRVNNGVNTTAYGNGHWSDLHVTGRIYADRLGVNLSLYAPTMSYSSLQNNNAPAGQYIINYWKSTGYGASIGIQYRLL